MSKTKVLIVITGSPGSGKTTLAERLRDRFNIPLLMVDEIKESLGDESLPSSLEESIQIGAISYEELYKKMHQRISEGDALIIEAPFHEKSLAPQVERCQEKYACRVLQIFLTCKKETMMERIKKRYESGNRHAVHFEYQRIAKDGLGVFGRYLKPIKLSGEAVVVDTTVINDDTFKPAIFAVETALHKASQAQAESLFVG